MVLVFHFRDLFTFYQETNDLLLFWNKTEMYMVPAFYARKTYYMKVNGLIKKT